MVKATNILKTYFCDLIIFLLYWSTVKEAGDTSEDQEARALLNKFLGATVLMAGMESMVAKEATKIVGAPITQRKSTKQNQQQVCNIHALNCFFIKHSFFRTNYFLCLSLS